MGKKERCRAEDPKSVPSTRMVVQSVYNCSSWGHQAPAINSSHACNVKKLIKRKEMEVLAHVIAVLRKPRAGLLLQGQAGLHSENISFIFQGFVLQESFLEEISGYC